jgi:hypothetical protein
MPRYRYRILRTDVWDKHGVPERKRGGDKPDRILELYDSEVDKWLWVATDEKGDDGPAFHNRAYKQLVAYLDGLGEDGWLVTQAPERGYLNGTFLLTRTEKALVPSSGL